jgi:hypothetical protein
MPTREPAVLEAAGASDGTAEVRLYRRSDGTYSFYVLAWTNFSDAGGAPHCGWYKFEPITGSVTDSLASARTAAIEDARARTLSIEEFRRAIA